MTGLYLKWTRSGRVPSYQGGEPIPVGVWTPTVDDLELCERGWHACRWDDAVLHISVELWVCELAAPIIEGDGKVVAGSLRLVDQVTVIDERSLRLFAADCAADVLHLFERDHPGDDRPRKAIEAARAYARGDIDDTARDAARDAALDAEAWAAAKAAWAAAWAAAGAAAEAAAWAAAKAAWAAAGAAAEAAARAAQTERLLVDVAGLNPDDFAHRAVPDDQ